MCMKRGAFCAVWVFSDSVTSGILVETGKMQSVTRCLDTWEMQQVARRLAWILLAFDIGCALITRERTSRDKKACDLVVGVSIVH